MNNETQQAMQTNLDLLQDVLIGLVADLHELNVILGGEDE